MQAEEMCQNKKILHRENKQNNVNSAFFQICYMNNLVWICSKWFYSFNDLISDPFFF